MKSSRTLPPELIQEILGKLDKASPMLVKEMREYMKKDTITRMLVCKNVIETGNIEEIKALKSLKGVCNHKDMIYAAQRGNLELVKFIAQNFEGTEIIHKDLVKAVRANNNKLLKVLLKTKEFKYTQDIYNELFINIQMDKNYTEILKTIYINRPKNSEVFLSDILTIVIGPEMKKFVYELVKVGVKIDEAFLFYQILDNNFDMVSVLLNKRGWGLEQTTLQALVNRSLENPNPLLTEFLVNYITLDI